MEIDHSWSIREAIEKQVEKEDQLGWALREEEEQDEHTMRLELPTQTWKPVINYIFGKNIIKFAHKLLP